MTTPSFLEHKNAEGDVTPATNGAGNPHSVLRRRRTGCTYNADGTVRLDLSDGSSILMSGTGDDAIILTSTSPEGEVSTYEYRSDGSYVVTTGDEHTLYSKDDEPIKTWKGDDESTAAIFGRGPNGELTLTYNDGTLGVRCEGRPSRSTDPMGGCPV